MGRYRCFQRLGLGAVLTRLQALHAGDYTDDAGHGTAVHTASYAMVANESRSVSALPRSQRRRTLNVEHICFRSRNEKGLPQGAGPAQRSQRCTKHSDCAAYSDVDRGRRPRQVSGQPAWIDAAAPAASIVRLAHGCSRMEIGLTSEGVKAHRLGDCLRHYQSDQHFRKVQR